ncbi:MAG TPA: ArsR family transcriptional regulator [Methanosarcina sp.]|jgi:DNA-binding transcriptional ArsR family regulator
MHIKDAYCLPKDVFEAVHMAMNQDVRDSLAYFKVLADPTRFKILKALEIQSLCVCVLVECTDKAFNSFLSP